MTEPVESINELNKDLFNPEEVDPFSNPIEARKKAMDYLARREYGRLELQAKLENAGFHSKEKFDAPMLPNSLVRQCSADIAEPRVGSRR